MATVAVVGLGAMGSRIARRLLHAGHRVIGWNRTTARAAELVDDGLELASSPAAAARAADVLLTMLADPSALRAVVEGEDGVAAGAGDSLTVVEMSTVGPAAVSWLAEALPRGTPLLDAPVLGSLSEAEAGSLAIFVGGPDDVAERWTPVLSALGKPIHVGPLGAGAAAKLVANTTLLGVLTVLGETLSLGNALGLERATVFEVLARTPLAAQAERRRQAVETFEYPLRFALALARKDAELISDAAGRAGRQLPLVEVARRYLAEAEQAGWGDYDYSSVLTWIAVREPNPPEPSV